jgi:hypothetical protein
MKKIVHVHLYSLVIAVTPVPPGSGQPWPGIPPPFP